MQLKEIDLARETSEHTIKLTDLTFYHNENKLVNTQHNSPQLRPTTSNRPTTNWSLKSSVTDFNYPAKIAHNERSSKEKQYNRIIQNSKQAVDVYANNQF